MCTVTIYSNSLSGHYLPHRLSIKNLMFGNRCAHDVVDDAPNTLQTSLAACEQKLFPNIFLCLYLLMVVPVSTTATEHSHSGLQIVKTKLESTMQQQRLNALMLLYIHKDIQINYPKIIDIYANRDPRRMLFKNPLAEEQEEKQKSM